MSIRPIKTKEDYEDALERIESLMDVESGSLEGDELEVLATLVELYERKHYPIEAPSPLEAIRFRMEQAELTQRDMIPLIGSRSKVSEVLSGKRPLNLKMIRNLHEQLGIPAEVLLQEPGAILPEEVKNLDWTRFPLREMAKRGWIPDLPNLKDCAEDVMRGLIKKAGNGRVLELAFFRKNDQVRQRAHMNPYALSAWCLQVLATARAIKLPAKYEPGTINKKFARNLARLSWYEGGPRLAREYLAKHGIHLLFVQHLPKTHLDGAALELEDGTPIVALTIRYDRVDNFWFCLFHELAHVHQHMKGTGEKVFVDDLTLRAVEAVDRDAAEQEADEWAEDALIPKRAWEESHLNQNPTPQAVGGLALKLEIHPAIVAGRVRFENRNYHLLSKFVGGGEIRKYCEFSPAVR